MRTWKALAAGTFLLGVVSSAHALDLDSNLEKDGSIPVKNLKEKQYPSAAKVTIKEAIDVALEKQEGTAISADLDDEGGFLIYEVTIATREGRMVDIFVDAGNKAVLGVDKDNGWKG